MGKLVRWLLRGVLVLGLIAAGLLGAGWWHARSVGSTPIVVNDPPLQLPTTSHDLAHGAHLFTTRGCTDCHGADGRGQLVFDAGPVARIVGANITPAVLKARGYDADRIAAAIRHGVRADGTPLIFMPAADFQTLSDADTAALVGYLGTLPDHDHDPGRSQLRPLGWVLNLLGRFPAFPALALEHAPRPRSAPEVKVSVEYGAYLAQVCTGCHGADFARRPPPGPGNPAIADLRPSALQGWGEADFIRAMREGKRPDGSDIDPFMPWRSMGRMSDTELRALWAYLSSLPPA